MKIIKQPTAKAYTIYTDGSCLKNPGGAGGIGAVIKSKGFYHEISEGFLAPTTNNQMEIMAAVRALEFLTEPAQIKLYSDSKYLVKTMTHNWKRRKNLDLWEMLDNACSIHSIKWKWVKGHAGNKHNETCDQLALESAISVRNSRESNSASKLHESEYLGTQLRLGF